MTFFNKRVEPVSRVIHPTSSVFRLPKAKELVVEKVAYPADPSWPSVDKTLEQQMLDAVNTYRTGMGLNSLGFNGNLIGCSEWKARNMAQFQYMQHDDPAEPAYNNFPGRTVYQRFIDWGFGNVAWGENIAYGFTDVQSVLHAFLSDIGHRQNVENSSWLSAGMGVCKGLNGLMFWVQDYSSVGGSPPPPPPTEHKIMIGQHWRNKKTHAGIKVYIYTSNPPEVYYVLTNKTAKKGQLTEKAFRSRFEWVSDS